MSRMPILPVWVLPPTLPSFYEAEGMTALESAAKVYGAMREMITDYNKFVEEINEQIRILNDSTSTEIQEIRESVEKRLQCKFYDLDAKMGEIKAELRVYAREYMEQIAPDTLPDVTTADNDKLLGVKNGVWTPVTATDMKYDPATESLTFNIVGG